MTLDPFRNLRLGLQAARDQEAGRGGPRNAPLEAASSRGAPRFVGRVVTRGATVAAVGRVFLVNPVGVDGPESEGASGSVAVDSARLVPVVVVGGRPPLVGELVVAHATGARWAAQVSGPPPAALPCLPCGIPLKSLTVSWTNGNTGTGSVALPFDGLGAWRNGCNGPLSFRLACDGGSLAFSATLFAPGQCPSGASQTCSSASADGGGLALVQQSCNPFFLVYQVTASGCPALAGRGYQQFAVSG